MPLPAFPLANFGFYPIKPIPFERALKDESTDYLQQFKIYCLQLFEACINSALLKKRASAGGVNSISDFKIGNPFTARNQRNYVFRSNPG